MQLWSLEGNRQRLDGGTMFGNCPRALWFQWCLPGEQNRIPLACRALLDREDSGRLVPFGAGIGAFFEPKLRERHGVAEAEPMRLAFPNAHFVVSEAAWQRAANPHSRDRASFIEGLPATLEQAGRVERVSSVSSEVLGSSYAPTFSDGHAPGLMLTRIDADDPGPVHFVGDLIPGAAWIHAPITMGCDRFPERLTDEKLESLRRLAESREWLFLFHDPDVALFRIERDERGRFHPAQSRASAGGLTGHSSNDS